VISYITRRSALECFGEGNGEGRDASSTGPRLPLTAAHSAVGFVPIGVVAGYGVGTVEQTGSLNCFAGCSQAASCSTSTVSIFAESAPAGLVWKNEEFSVVLGTLSGERYPNSVRSRTSTGHSAAP